MRKRHPSRLSSAHASSLLLYEEQGQLVSIVEGEMEADPFSADLYIFCNRTRTLVKMVAWEGNGFVLWMKRLEDSRFKWPLSGSEAVVQLTVQRRSVRGSARCTQVPAPASSGHQPGTSRAPASEQVLCIAYTPVGG